MLDRLLGRLTAPWSCGFIHVDVKGDDEAFSRVVQKHPQWSLLPDSRRVDVKWAGFSVVEAILSLLGYAVSQRPDTERFFILSGCDYPLRPIEEIGRLISVDEDLIRIDGRLDPDGESAFDQRANRFHFCDCRPLNPRSGHRWFIRAAERITRELRRPHPEGISIYCGSCWHCLTRSSAHSVLRFITERRDVVRWFRHAFVSDEMFIHTILKTEGFEGRIAFDATVHRDLKQPPGVQGTHYIDWEHPNPSTPRVLDMEDFELLRTSNALFARKFHPVYSGDLLDRLDRKPQPPRLLRSCDEGVD